MDLSPDEDNFQGRLLHQAALWDNVELLQELLSNGADINSLDGFGRSCLHAAAVSEDSKCLVVLCDSGADLEVRSDERQGQKTALHIAAERGLLSNVRALAAAGADVTAKDASGATAAELAAKAGYLAVVAVLDSYAADQVSRRSRARQTVGKKKREESVETDAAFEVTQYFSDDVRDPWREGDAQERERLAHHSALRSLLAQGDVEGLRRRLQTLGTSATLVVNLTPGGANTLLFVASEAGLTDAVSALLDSGADGRAHPVTNYSPLYAAAYQGHVDVARLLLRHFPEAVKLETVEKWLPLHAACIGGHAAMVSLLLDYPYPEEVMETYTHKTGRWQYRFPFDINACDVRNQTPVCVVSALGSLPVLTTLIHFSVECEVSPEYAENKITPEVEQKLKKVLSPTRGGISLGIHAIVSRLTGVLKPEQLEAKKRVFPLRFDVGAADSCVALAARGNHALCVAALLNAGAQANSFVKLDTNTNSSRKSRSTSAPPPRRNGSSDRRDASKDRDTLYSALTLAIRHKNSHMADLLIENGASDENWQALREAVANNMMALIPKILNIKAYQDPENKVNRQLICRNILSSVNSSLSLNARCPSAPVMLNWQGNNVMDTLRVSWLRSAAILLNPGVSHVAALHAITRVDVSNSELRSLPHELFTMMSLKHLNAAQNKLERLPAIGDSYEEEEEKKKGKRSTKVIKELYTAPVLQELYLQDNRLEVLPPELFSLPSLQSLDVSNNKLRVLPSELWACQALKELNAALNHLKDLPGRPVLSPALSPKSEAPPGRKSNRESTASELADIVHVERKLSAARHAHGWAGRAAPGRGSRGAAPGCPLATLNLAHNQYTTVPDMLACVAPNLTRLNMSYNSLRSMSYVTSYPKHIRQLDLSHNEITCWPSLPPLEDEPAPGSPLYCSCVAGGVAGGEGTGPPRAATYREALLRRACAAKRHLTLHALRTLILSNNLLTRIQLTTDDDGSLDNEDETYNDDDDEWGENSGLRHRLVFPQLSMLDLSRNALRSVPPSIQYLTNLCVFNINENKEVTTLPASMGVLTRLWSVSTSGCNLTEPLRSLLATRCRSSEVIGYLRSVLHEAKPYRNVKLMCVGQQGIGKTSLLECLRQESGVRRKHADHWTVRMGNKMSTKNMSTVGVDIGTWTYEKHRSMKGPVHFRTWDFGGQQEYYATHQYFLSKRSLYLVLWKVTDGRKGLAGALHWLRSIQARAPGSPVIMVATHYDQVPNSNLPENESPEILQRIIRTSIMGAPDADKLGLPRVMDSLEVSCNTRHNMRLLADIIYSVAHSVKPPGSKEPVLSQMVPASYLALEECVTYLASELKEPVLRHEEYKYLVTKYMQHRNYRKFRDAAELHQATMFLHENGVLLHYDDATLRQLYFLRPQWLCDLLSHVVSVREVNPFVSNGIMKTEDLAHVFKASPQLGGSEEASTLALALLSKFELALCWQPRLLLVPPLLPEYEPAAAQLPIKSREWSSKLPRRWQFSSVEVARAESSSPKLIDDSAPQLTLIPRSGCPLRRIVALSYVPPGLWPRLCTRLVAAAPQSLPLYTTELDLDESISKALDLNWCWKLWKRGMKLVCGDVTLVAVSQVDAEWDELLPLPGRVAGGGIRYRVKQDDVWCVIDAESSARIEVTVPSQTCTVKRNDGKPIAGYQSITLEPNIEILAKILALVSDQLDMLLEDWYPSLGTRFVHTSEGRTLITRLIPCPACLREHELPDDDPEPQEFNKMELEQIEPRLSQDSRFSDTDSGVGGDVTGSVESVSWAHNPHGAVHNPHGAVHAWTVEQATAAALTCKPVHCPKHGETAVSGLAPDLMLLDIEESKRARWEHISRLAPCGRGAFGTVLTAEWAPPGGPAVKVALKTLQPVTPPTRDAVAFQKYKADASRWARAPAACAARAYSALRAESGVLRALRHPHALSLTAVCPAPAALLLPLAPLGALDGILRKYSSAGFRIPPRVARAIALQMARALEYLHAMRVLYRDLKSENVLVWEMPTPQESIAAELSSDPVKVFVKLGDYGISRLAPTTGTKGFGGTEGFMAPEIMKYNGEEEYNEKVDCFSYGMLLYEIITLRQPFEGHEAVKEAILEGARPNLTPREVQYPVCILETMRSCWNSAPDLRPSAAALVSLCSAPEWCTLLDAAVARRSLAAAAVPVVIADCSEGGWEVWSGGGEPERVHISTVSRTSVTAHQTALVPPDKSGLSVLVTSLCRVGPTVWVGDSLGRVTVYCAASCSILWSVHVTETCGGAMSAVTAMCHLSDMDRVALALSCGRLFLVTSTRPDADSEGSFILTELGTSTQLNCLAAVPLGDGWQVWAGGGALSVYCVSGGAVRAAHTLDVTRVALLAARAGGVLAYIENGSTIYGYSSSTLTLTARLDCSKLVPCSETLDSISLDQQHWTAVTSLCVVRNEVYAGTATGSIIVADAESLRPLTIFRPLEAEIMSIVGLIPHAGISETFEEEPPLLLTFGSGYRPLVQRYAPAQAPTTSTTLSYNGPFCLLWRAHHWLPD